jgi:hypothetical protein
LATALKEQLALLASLVLLVGLVSTDAYYASFQISYQQLALPTARVAPR